MNYKNKNWLTHKYAIENLSSTDIAELCGVSKRTINYWVNKYKIIKLFKDPIWLRTQYELGLSTTEIAKLANTNSSVIVRNLQKFGIKTRSIAEANKAKWQDNNYKYKLLAKLRSDQHRRKLKQVWTSDARTAQRHTQYEVWQRSGYREKQSKIQSEIWAKPEHKQKMAKIMATESWRLKNAAARSKMPRVSNIQRILYSILDDLNVDYYREYEDKPADKQCTIGPWTFDCVIPRTDKPTLLIECQGDYFHNLPDERARDKSKATYVSSLPEYELKYIWEHEFKNYTKVVELIKYWMGYTAVDVIDFNFDEIKIKACPSEDYKLLLSKYHYLSNAGRGGIAYGGYRNDELASVCIFSPLPRQNIKIDSFSYTEVRELSRLCIHPKYQRKNFASWFISRCLKLLPKKYKCIIAYSDTTFNHDGAIYKACNFKKDMKVSPEYWYLSEDGWKMHKKTLYNHAVKMGMTESQFAAVNNYRKIFGNSKIRYKFLLENRGKPL